MFKCEGREVYPERPEEVSGSPSRATIGKETFAKREGFFVSKGEGQKKGPYDSYRPFQYCEWNTNPSLACAWCLSSFHRYTTSRSIAQLEGHHQQSACQPCWLS